MEAKELVSIVVPVYNMGDSIETCVCSILAQKYTNIEVILVDDGSKDDSYARCQALAQQDNRVVVYHTENRGSGPARNYGIAHATGRYIYFPDADDHMEPDAISTMLQAMEGGKHDMVVFGYTTLGTQGNMLLAKRYKQATFRGETVRNSYANYVATGGAFCIQGAPWNKFFDLHVIRDHGIEFPPLRRHQDDAFIARYMCHAKSIHFIPEALYIHYANDLQLEWKKYPVDYIDVVKGLYNIKKETILTWNSDDTATHEIITREYICNVIKAMELTFSPKHGLKFRGRMEKIKAYVCNSGICQIDAPNGMGVYQRVVLQLLHSNCYGVLYAVLLAKIYVEKVIR